MTSPMKWYNCPKCDAGYLDQACICDSETKNPKGKNLSQDNWDTMNTFVEELNFLWKEYALADDSTLTEDAKELKRQLLAAVRESTDAAYYKGMRDGVEEYKKAFTAGFEADQL
jgi:hypothetical protein